ncbi:MAG TPA: LysE family translocator [Chloroflexota bacterium]|nr:LysE family translocator [Chloroflexota bacterium]
MLTLLADPRFLGFLGLCVLITLTPGADTALVTRNVVARGRRAGVLTALGASTGLFAHAVAVALGVSAILLTSAAAFMALKLAGATYLAVLGLLALRGALRAPAPAPTARDGGSAPTEVGHHGRLARLGHPYAQGLLSNLTNPKAAIFFLTVLPPFLVPGAGAVPRALGLALVPVALNILWLSAYAGVLGAAAPLLRRPAVRRLHEGLLGLLLLGFGARLALDRR